MTLHSHRHEVEGCFRCELSRDELRWEHRNRENDRGEADRVALELITHATASAKKLGCSISPQRVLDILITATNTSVPDPEFAALIIERGKTFLDQE